MKKLFLGLAVVAGSMAFAQQFGVKAGGNVAHLSGKVWEMQKQDLDTMQGYSLMFQ